MRNWQSHKQYFSSHGTPNSLPRSLRPATAHSSTCTAQIQCTPLCQRVLTHSGRVYHRLYVNSYVFVTSLQSVTGLTFTGKVILSTDWKKWRNTYSLWPLREHNMESRKLQLAEPYQRLHKDRRKPRKPSVQVVVGRSLTSANLANRAGRQAKQNGSPILVSPIQMLKTQQYI